MKPLPKLSSKQKEVIERLQKGDLLHHITGIHARCFFREGGRNIPWSTIFRLEELNLVVRTHNEIQLTENGKAWFDMKEKLGELP